MYPRDLPVLSTATPMPLALPGPFFHQQSANSGMSLSQLASIIWSYRKLSLLITASVILAAGIACAMWPRTYQATAALMVEFEINDPLAGREFPTNLISSYMATQVDLTSGSGVLNEVVERLKLARSKKYAAGYTGEAAGLHDWVVTGVRKKLVVEQGKYGSQIINVTYSAGTAVEAAQVANAVAEVYSEQQHKRLTGPAAERAQRQTEQLEALKIKVTRSQEQLSDFRQRSGLINSDARADVDVHATLIQSMKGQLALQNTQMAGLRATLGTQHPQVLELQSQINATNQTMYTEISAYSGKAKAERVAAKYQLELESAQSVYARALDGYDQAMFAATGSYSNIEFVSRATPPSKASKPKVGILMLLACVVGGALGLAIPLCYELLNRRVRCRDDIERDHGIPVLAELGPIGAITNMPARGAA